MSFDLSRALRRLRAVGSPSKLARRKTDNLPFVGDVPTPGPELLLDTTIYIDSLRDKLPRNVAEFLSLRFSNHSAVCLAELTHSLGRLSPDHPGSQGRIDLITRTINAIPRHRLRAPSQSVWGDAGLLTGLAFRVGGYQAGQERALLNDTLIFLQGLENGQVVVTGNIGDFDILCQLVPEGRVLYYRRDQHPG